MQHGTLSQRSFVRRFTLSFEGRSRDAHPHRWIPWPPWRQINGAAIRIEIKPLKIKNVRISNQRYSPVFESRTDAAKDVSPVLVLIYGAAIRIEIKHLKTNDLRISNHRYSRGFESKNAVARSHPPLSCAPGLPARPASNRKSAIRIHSKHLKTKDGRQV